MARSTRPRTNDPVVSLQRRGLCLGLLTLGASVACGGASQPAPAPATPPPAGGNITTTDTKAGLLASPAGTVRDYRNLGALLIRDAVGIYAMTSICTHLGCTVGQPVGNQITCPCHGSQYDLNGLNTLGPATQPLVHFLVKESAPGAMLIIDLGQTVTAATRLT